MSATRHPWAVEVHAALLASGEELTSDQIRLRFGRPKGASSVALRLANAVKGGWLVQIPIEGTRFYRYKARQRTASDWTPRDTHPVPVFNQVGRGFPRVRSIFDLAGVL